MFHICKCVNALPPIINSQKKLGVEMVWSWQIDYAHIVARGYDI
jgi:hypothetical protein